MHVWWLLSKLCLLRHPPVDHLHFSPLYLGLESQHDHGGFWSQEPEIRDHCQRLFVANLPADPYRRRLQQPTLEVGSPLYRSDLRHGLPLFLRPSGVPQMVGE